MLVLSNEYALRLRSSMDGTMSSQEQQLCQFLAGLAAKHKYRFTDAATRELLESLFWSMAGGRPEYLKLFFPDKGGPARPKGTLKLREAQGAVDGAEYTEAARGKACGHIFRPGEATYTCRTCSTDDTCVLCSRCFDSTDHTGHMVRISLSPGNSGCCDCGDPEAWKLPVFCTIHSEWEGGRGPDKGKGKAQEPAAGELPEDLVASIRMTIGRVFDFLCDVVSCSPEQLRSTKTVASIEQDERMSRLSSVYGGGDVGPPEEYTVLLWNDEKHTVNDVRDQVARACRVSMDEGRQRAYETDTIGRSTLKHSRSVEELLEIARVLEQIKLTVTIRSSREVFREQMCGAMIEWLLDISGCSVGQDHSVLLRVVCEQMLLPWRLGSPASHAIVGANGMDDEELIVQTDDREDTRMWLAQTQTQMLQQIQLLQGAQQWAAVGLGQAQAGGDSDDDDDYDEDEDEDGDEDMEDTDPLHALLTGETGRLRTGGAGTHTGARDGDDDDDEDENDDVVMVDAREAPDVNMPDWRQTAGGERADLGQALEEEDEAATAGLQAGSVPPPPPPPPAHPSVSQQQPAASQPTAGSGAGPGPASAASHSNATATGRARRPARDRDLTPSDSDTAAEPLIAQTYAKNNMEVPKTPGVKQDDKSRPRPGRYWLGVPQAYMDRSNVPVAEDLFGRVRLDWMVLFDLRMWKKVRNDLRSLYISTVVTIPKFKRVLGLRFAGLYTTLAQLYLIGDREPDHSIINISLQMLTTPSITAEIVERGNFLTSLMAILYTFLTRRQVGHPWHVASNAVLAFDTGSVANRRMYHFFQDLKFLFGSPHVQERLRSEERYMLQFLDLAKLHQGICPNTRAVGEHVEYETDSWINASLVTREINRLCRQFAEAFRSPRDGVGGNGNGDGDGDSAPDAAAATGLGGSDGDAAAAAAADAELLTAVSRAIRLAAKTVIINSIGAERARFTGAEIRDEVRFKTLGDFEFDVDASSGSPRNHEVVRFVVEEQPISFHHALHYTLSWLVECGRSMPRENLRALLSFSSHELRQPPRSMGRKTMPRRELGPEDYLLAAFDYPLRVCAWLSQMKAGMWVRNGMSLRHQAGTYRGVLYRDVSHHRDIFLLQTAMVTCDPARVLASVVDRFGMEKWAKGFFEQKSTAQDDVQHLEVVEDMMHLLIVLLSDRTALVPAEAEPDAHLQAVRRDVVHVLCFKPLSFSEICAKLPEKYHEQESFHRVLADVANYRAPEGISDVGTFELRPQFVEDVDPYISHYNKNQREEAETAWRKRVAARTGRPFEDVVFEPKLRRITSGAFVGLADFTRTGMFAQTIYYSLLYPLVAQQLTPNVPFTRIETFLQVVLHLILIAIAEDKATAGEDSSPSSPSSSFIEMACTRVARSNFMPEAPSAKTIVALLDLMSTRLELKACNAKIVLILKRMRQRQPRAFEAAYSRLGLSIDRISTASPANNTSAEEERERKKKAALDRQARVMAQFQQQQKSFLENQAQGGGIDWGDDIDVDDDDDDMGGGVGGGSGLLDATASGAEYQHKKMWRYPTGTCILCQEDTDERRLYGTFAFVADSQILRQTDLQDPDFVREAASTPRNLDRSAEAVRPFGVAGENRRTVEKINAAGETFLTERQLIGRGFPARNSRTGPVSTGCGHMMHYACFEVYFRSSLGRHAHQIARHHPENTDRLEFVCPLCKALGNTFLPIIWRGREEAYPGALLPSVPFVSFLETQMGSATKPYYSLAAVRPHDQVQNMFRDYTKSMLLKELADRSSQLLVDVWDSASGQQGGAGSSAAGAPSRPSAASRLANLFATPQNVVAEPTQRARAAAAAASSAADAAGSGSGSSGDMMKELVAVYGRLRDTLVKADILKQHAPLGSVGVAAAGDSDELFGSDALARAVGFSISAVEISQRGTDAEYGATLLDRIPEQVLTQLRILAETADAFVAVAGQRCGGENRVEAEFRRSAERQHCQLFMSRYVGLETDHARRPIDAYPPLLSADPFVFLCECVFGVARAQQMEIAHLVRLCYLAEITKVVYHMGRNMPTQRWISPLVNPQTDDPTLRNFASFCLGVVEQDMTIRARVGVGAGVGAGSDNNNNSSRTPSSASDSASPASPPAPQSPHPSAPTSPPSSILDVSILAADSLGPNLGFEQPGLDSLDGYYQFVRRYALVFLRKCVVLLYVRFGVDFNSHVSPSPELEELERLSEALRVPSFDEMCASLSPSSASASVPASQGLSAIPTGSTASGKEKDAWPARAVQQLVGGWIRHDVMHPRRASDSPSSPPLSALVSHPGVFELVGLPKNYDSLIEECAKGRCPTTGKDLVEAHLCLMCGAVFCGQGICCLKEENVGRGRSPIYIGGCQQHMRKCQKNIALFINIRKCAVFYLHRGSGSFSSAPYIDKYGEVDQGLRHGRQLLLSQKRYDTMLRSLWLTQGIPSFIARKLESEINNGGWETI